MKIDNFVEFKDQISTIGSHEWSVARLAELSKDFPVMNVPLDHLNVWHDYKHLRLRDFVMHMKAVNAADLSFPIILDEDGEIMDGRHRIMKAMLTGRKTIPAVRFDENPRPCRINEDEK